MNPQPRIQAFLCDGTGWLLCATGIVFPFSVAATNVALGLALVAGVISGYWWRGAEKLWRFHRRLSTVFLAYLALVFRESKGWLLKRYEKRYGASELSWSINASLPADSLQPQLVERYKQILYSAWNLSVLPGPITLNRVSQFMDIDEAAFDAFPAVYRSRLVAKNQVNVFSSCNAQICGYVHSKKCRHDLHMLIDVGAVSISIATFMVALENESANGNRCTLFACSTEAIGVGHLLKRRFENLQLPEALK